MAAAPGSPAPPSGAGRLPAAVLLALEPRAREPRRANRWLVRVGAGFLASMVLGLLLGPCMRLPAAGN